LIYTCLQVVCHAFATRLLLALYVFTVRLPRVYCSFIVYVHILHTRIEVIVAHNFTIINPRHAYARGLYSSCVSVCPSAGANLGTGTSRRLQQYRCNAKDKASVHRLHHKSTLCLSACTRFCCAFTSHSHHVHILLATHSHIVGHAFTSCRPCVQAPLAIRLCLVCHAFTPFSHAFTVQLSHVLVPNQTCVKRGVNACET